MKWISYRISLILLNLDFSVLVWCWVTPGKKSVDFHACWVWITYLINSAQCLRYFFIRIPRFTANNRSISHNKLAKTGPSLKVKDALGKAWHTEEPFYRDDTICLLNRFAIMHASGTCEGTEFPKIACHMKHRSLSNRWRIPSATRKYA